MCSIYGAFGPAIDTWLLAGIQRRARDRGRDGGGGKSYQSPSGKVRAMLGSWRATPTPEIQVAPPQPYQDLVHNGTIANDKELGGKEGEVDSMALARHVDRASAAALALSLESVKGSYSLACWNGESVLLAANYKPLYYYSPDGTNVYFSSMARHLDGLLGFGRMPVKLEPYSALDLRTRERADIGRKFEKRAVVVCSAGLDSTVTAAKLRDDGWKVCLLHFLYRCRAEGKERQLIPAIAEVMGCEHKFLVLNYDDLKGGSPLLTGGAIAGPMAGAEYASEWVPARNFAFLGLAVAYAEANGYHAVALGNNLEEAGAYPDNEEELTYLLDQAAPNMVQNGHHMRVLSPVGNLMKHEIVRLGLELGAPLELTWSCYHGGERHCGNCGPCFMRREAFRRCGADDPVFAGAGV